MTDLKDPKLCAKCGMALSITESEYHARVKEGSLNRLAYKVELNKFYREGAVLAHVVDSVPCEQGASLRFVEQHRLVRVPHSPDWESLLGRAVQLQKAHFPNTPPIIHTSFLNPAFGANTKVMRPKVRGLVPTDLDDQMFCLYVQPHVAEIMKAVDPVIRVSKDKTEVNVDAALRLLSVYAENPEEAQEIVSAAITLKWLEAGV